MAETPLDYLRRRIRAAGLGEHESRILKLARPCVRVTRTPVDQGDLGPLDSRLGGAPHLPLGMSWPVWRKVPLAHLATIRLSEASQHDTTGLLPSRGLLYFWYDAVSESWGFDPKDAGFCRIDYVADEGTPLQQRVMPLNDVPAGTDLNVLRESSRVPCRVSFEPALSLPDGVWAREYCPEAAAIVDVDEYWELSDTLVPEPKHQLLGHPCPQQGPMELECQLVTHNLYCGNETGYNDPRAKALEAGARDWLLLFQIDSDESGPGWMWGDVGMLYYWIPEPALRAADFSKAWMILQCS